jgi:DNA-binding HxlR family transcriptional regulator
LPTFALIMEEENNIAFRSFCPIATGLDVLGDKWTLLILRDMIFGHKKLFNEFKESPEKVPSKMLSNRLRKLENIGFITRAKGEINKNSVYYLLEKKGLDTLPLMVELMLFTTEFYYDHLGDTYTLDVQTKMKTDKVKYIKDISAKYMQFQQSLVF